MTNPKALTVLPLVTRVFHPREDLEGFVAESVPRSLVREKMILAVTSKIISLAEGRLLAKSGHAKEDIVREEADIYLGAIGYGCFLTIKHGLLLPSAGIDESNSETGDFILYPRDPFASAESLRRGLCSRWGVKDLGVLVTDSHTTPLRRGVTGVCLSYSGFRAVRNLVGSPDLFGRELRMTRMNLADGLAAAAVMMMGEGDESRPLAVIENAEVEFSEDTQPEELRISPEEDLYAPLLSSRLRS
jgi:coenzyme F420-0:L-glutamate ligase